MPPLPVSGAAVALLALAATGVSHPDVRCPEWGAERLRRLEAQLVERVNARRHRLGRPRLARDPALDRVARRHARFMAEAGRLGHPGPGGSTVGDRLRSAGVRDWGISGENLARFSSTRYRVTDERGRWPSVSCFDPESLGTEIEAGWATSPGHRAALLSADYGRVGSGAAYDPVGQDVYAVHVFADRAACGFRGGPCCSVELRPSRRSCQTPLVCADEVCR